ncbi:hypothetical protein Gpo141_00003635 [Globisporangium polare]
MTRAHVQARNPIHNAPRTSAPFATDAALAASVAERRTMKKVAQPEHAYTGCVPQRDEPEIEELPVKRNPPILGYKGHLRNAQDRIGTTFTNGLEAATRPAEPVGYRGASNQRDASGKMRFEATRDRQPNPHVRFQVPLPQPGRPGNGVAAKDKPQAQMSPRSKYEAFENASGYGEFLAKPPMSGRSGYGEFEEVSGYGEFLEKPPTMSKRSGYGAFDNVSGYGEFQARPLQHSERSGYGEFDNASGYGEFQAKPPEMSLRSAYGEFDNASGYGEFQARPPTMSKRSGYGAFDNASGYGEFQEPPPPQMSARSGYGAFEDASGYGEFAAPPLSMSHSLAYGAFDHASGYGEFMEAPSQENQFDSPSSKEDYHSSPSPTTLVLKYSESLDKKYQQAMKAVGGKTNVLKLWHAAAATISCRHRKRTELLQSIRRSFEKREPENGGRMTKEHLKEALQSLACVFTDDQVTALFGLYDAQCKGTHRKYSERIMYYLSHSTMINFKVFSQGSSGRNDCATAGSPGD